MTVRKRPRRPALLMASLLLASSAAHTIQQLCSRLDNHTLKIGVLSKGNAQLTIDRWNRTFVDYLTSSLARWGCCTQIVIVGFTEYQSATASRSIDFLFANPVAYQEMQMQHGARAVVSVRRKFGSGQLLDQFGGVLLRSSSRLTNVVEVADLTRYSNLTICAVTANAFGGWLMQWYEMIQAGVDVRGHTLAFLGNHEECITRTVVTNQCDVGVVRTETVERLVQHGEVEESDVFVIGERRHQLNFSLHLSTTLYPEWPLAVLSHVPPVLEYLVAIPLLALNAFSPEAMAGDHGGFVLPYSYEPVKRLLIALDYFGTGQCYPGHYRTGDGPGSCEPCPERTFSDDGVGSCTPCSLGFGTNGTGSVACTFGLNMPAPTLRDEVLPLGLFYCSWVVNVLFYVLAVVLLVWTWRHRQHEQLKASQPEFLLLIILGACVSMSTVFPLSLDHRWFEPPAGLAADGDGSFPPLDAICQAQVWLYCMGFMLSYGSLFGKLWRVKQLIINPKLRNVKISIRHLLLRIGVLVVLDGLLLTAWTLVAPLSYKVALTQIPAENAVERTGYCSPDNSSSAVFLVFVGLVNVGLLAYGLVLVLQSRHVPTAFNEGKYIAIAVANTMQAMVLSEALTLLIYDQKVPFFVVSWVALLVINVGMLALIFVPKILTMAHGGGGRTGTHPMGSSAEYSVPTRARRSSEQKGSSTHSAQEGRAPPPSPEREATRGKLTFC